MKFEDESILFRDNGSFDFLAASFSLCIDFSPVIFVVSEGEHYTKYKVRKYGWKISLPIFVYTYLFKVSLFSFFFFFLAFVEVLARDECISSVLIRSLAGYILS